MTNKQIPPDHNLHTSLAAVVSTFRIDTCSTRLDACTFPTPINTSQSSLRSTNREGRMQRPVTSSPSPSCYSRFWSSATRSKPISPPPDSSVRESLARRLGLFDLILIGVGASIGAGIFVVTGTVARDTGPGQLLVTTLH